MSKRVRTLQQDGPQDGPERRVTDEMDVTLVDMDLYSAEWRAQSTLDNLHGPYGALKTSNALEFYFHNSRPRKCLNFLN